MKKSQKNFKLEFRCFIKNILYELAISILLGAVPVLTYSVKNNPLDDTVKVMLATKPLIDYAAFLLFLYITATAVRFIIRLKSEAAQEKLVFLHKLTAEIGTSFLTIMRTGLGVMLGILYLASFTDIIDLSTESYTALCLRILMVLIATNGVSFLHILLANTSISSTYKNPIKFDKKLIH